MAACASFWSDFSIQSRHLGELVILRSVNGEYIMKTSTMSAIKTVPTVHFQVRIIW
jgi:hypothetical protein